MEYELHRKATFVSADEPVMRFEHRAGDKCFVDYAGQTAEVLDRSTGEVKQAQIFVAVLGASNFTYVEATWTQSLPDWIAAHQRAFAFFGGVPEIVVPDNLKSGVTKAHRYEPDLNPTYAEMAAHYGVGVLPARPRKPRDKAKVEAGVRFAQTYILGRLRRQTFFSLAEANAAIASAVERINAHVMRRLGVSRRELFESIERPALRPLPSDVEEFAVWGVARVCLGWRVEARFATSGIPRASVGPRRSIHATPGVRRMTRKTPRSSVD